MTNLEQPFPVYTEEIQEFDGLVLATDALGIKELVKSDPAGVIHQLQRVADGIAVDKKFEQVLRFFAEMDDFEEPFSIHFQDTNVVVWKGDLSLDLLTRASRWCGLRMETELCQHSKPRGSLAFGHCVVGKGRILLEAWYDACDWMEKADWMGWLATPTFSRQIADFRDSLDSDQKQRLDEHWCYYSVPICKTVQAEELAVPLWPRHYWLNQELHLDRNRLKLLDYYVGQLELLDFSGAESKRDNAVAFFSWCLECGLFRDTAVLPADMIRPGPAWAEP